MTSLQKSNLYDLKAQLATDLGEPFRRMYEAETLDWFKKGIEDVRGVLAAFMNVMENRQNDSETEMAGLMCASMRLTLLGFELLAGIDLKAAKDEMKTAAGLWSGTLREREELAVS